MLWCSTVATSGASVVPTVRLRPQRCDWRGGGQPQRCDWRSSGATRAACGWLDTIVTIVTIGRVMMTIHTLHTT